MSDSDLPGKWYGPLSLKPLIEAVEFVKSTADYTREKRYAAGCPVHRAHPGLKSTMVTDYPGMEAVFHAPPEDLDRELEPGFGCLKLHYRELLDGVVPALVAHGNEGDNHSAARALVDRALALRRGRFLPACQRVLDGGWPALRGLSEAPFGPAIYESAAAIVFDWLFDLSPGPPGEAHQAWVEQCFGLRTDTPLTNALAGLLKRPPQASVRAYSRDWMGRIEGCRFSGEYLEIGDALGLPRETLPAHLWFAAGFNAVAGVFATLYPALAQVSVDRDMRARLAGELAGFAGDADALHELPYLDAFFYESMRIYGRPRQYYRRAMRDLSLPSSAGDVSIPAGTRLGLVATIARQDSDVFGRDAARFDPQRFIEQPELKRRIYPFGPPADGPSPYGCAGAVDGSAPRLWKVLAAALARDTGWRLVPSPEVGISYFSGVKQEALTWRRG